MAYVRNALGEMVEDLRRELHPEHAHLPAHISVLPPRALLGTEEEALEFLSAKCRAVEPFEVVMGDVEAFLPTTPTVFIRVAHAAYKMRELHDILNTGVFACEESLPYMPHLTIAKLDTDERARQVYEISRERWSQYSGSRRFLIESLTFVRGRAQEWTDLAPVALGGRSVVAR
ncbi:MAG TPA: 2'-5' RNA ligase family protein [Clostridia bacterium]|nr:2'-5' RNA ligase family protein [Clostridia bacterium]